MKPSCERCGAPRPAASTSPCLRCGSLAADEASGLIDVRKIAVTPRPPSQPRLGNLLIAPVVAAAPTPAPPRRPARASQAPLYAMIGLLTFGVVGLAAASLRTPAEPARSTVLVVAAAPEHPHDVADEPPAPREPEPEPVARPSEPTTPPATSIVKEPRKPRRTDATDRPAKPDKPAPAPETKPPAPATPAASEDPDEVRCLLEPARCKKPEAAPEPPPSTPSKPSLPETLSLADMSEGMSAGKAAASAACRSLARGGEVVRLRISIEGPTGAVLKAEPEADGGNPELARCCADALKKTTFRPVQKPQIGAATTLKF